MPMQCQRALVVLLLAAFATLAACGDQHGGDSAGGSKGFGALDDVQLRVNPGQVTFGGVSQGKSASATVRITHSGPSGTLRISELRFESESSELSAILPEPAELQPGDGIEVLVTYTAADALPDQGRILVIHDATNQPSPFEVPVSTGSVGGVLVASPKVLDFGTVATATHSDLPAALLNLGTGDLLVTGLAITGESAGDFSLPDLPSLPVLLAPGDRVDVPVRYAPTWWNADEGALEVTTDAPDSPLVVVQLQGAEKGPKVVVSPPDQVSLGSVQVGDEVTRPIKVLSQGNDALRVTRVSLLPGHEPGLSLEGAPADEVELAPGEKIEATIRFAPKAALAPDEPEPIGTVRIETNDPAEPVIDVPVRAYSGFPVIDVLPAEQVHFGIVAQTITIKRTVTIVNDGYAPLEVSEIRFTAQTNAEFEIIGDPTFAPIATPPVPGLIPPGEARTFDVTFTNHGGPDGEGTGGLTILSNDQDRPSWTIDLFALRAGPPTCEPKLVPQKLDFGPVSEGSSRVLTATIQNEGTGYCTFVQAKVEDCPEVFPYIFECESGKPSYEFEVLDQPDTAPMGIEPKGTAPLKVRFTAPPLGKDAAWREARSLLVVEVTNPHDGDALISVPGGFTDTFTPTPNLIGASAKGLLQVTPPVVDFGLTTLGCHSQTRTVTITNKGDAPLELDSVTLVDCGPEVEIKVAPALPFTLTEATPASVQVVYAPQDLGVDACQLEVSAGGGGQLASVSLLGKGTLETKVTDVFDKVFDGVDVLFVVDDSGSMSEDQENLSTNFESFLAHAKTWGVDFHLGVVTTDVDDLNKAGRLQGEPRYVTEQTSEAFFGNVLVGTSGSGTERGLEAARLALSHPLATDTGETCLSDTDCTAPMKCVAGGCGGHNRSFLRKKAALSVIVVSDEEDQSPKALTDYIDFLKGLVFEGKSKVASLHAIVGTGLSDCSAEEGVRYIEAAKSMDGKVASICDEDFSETLSDIAGGIFGAQYAYHLSRYPMPTTIKIQVDGAPCTTGWTFDSAKQAVVFSPTSSCLPQPGQVVTITYEAMCFPD